jgi:hypothetical protein
MILIIVIDGFRIAIGFVFNLTVNVNDNSTPRVLRETII